MDFGTRSNPPSNAGDGDLVKDGTTASFVKDVIEASKDVPVIVDFWAAWCGPCKQLTPILERVVRAFAGKVKLVKIDVDANQAVAAQLRIQSMPTVYAFRDGRPLDGFVGAQSESEVRAFVERLVGADEANDIEAVLNSAAELIDEGDLQGAAEIYAAILQEDRENVAALAGLAQCYLKTGDYGRARQTISLVVPEKRSIPVVEAVNAALDLAEKAANVGDLAGFELSLESNPSDHQARFDLAIGLAGMGKKAEALDHLLEIMRRDRKWNDEAARKQLLQFFDAWGSKEPLVGEGRRRLSSLLFS